MQQHHLFGTLESFGRSLLGPRRGAERAAGSQIERIALVKFVLALANILVIYLDKTVPIDESRHAMLIAISTAALFAVYMLLMWLTVRRDWLPLEQVLRWQPLGDALAITCLILATDGYLSPFNVWYAISIVSTGFSGSGLTPLMGALIGIIAQMLVAIIPQATPLDGGVFTVRALFLLGFASLIAILSNQLVRQAAALQAVAGFGQMIAAEVEAEVAVQRYEMAVVDLIGADSVQFDEASLDDAGPSEVLISQGGSHEGVCRVTRGTPLTDEERQLIRLLGERLASTLRRIDLGHALIEAAAHEERQRYADELHDTHLQTLAAIDLLVEIASKRGSPKETASDLKEIKTTVRDAAQRTRQFISSIHEYRPSGPTVVREVLQERMPACQIEIDDDVHLTEGQWRAVQMMAKEGLNNAMRHGVARAAWFTLRRHDGRIEARLESDGKPPQANAKYGYGLRRLQTIVEANRGTIHLSLGKRGGASLVAEFVQESDSPS